MTDNGRAPDSLEHVTNRRRTLRSFQERRPERDASDNEAAANPPATQLPSPPLRRIIRPPQAGNLADWDVDQTTAHPLFGFQASEHASTTIPSATDSPPPGPQSSRGFIPRARRRDPRDLATGSGWSSRTRTRRGSLGSDGIPTETSVDHQFADALEHELLGNEAPQEYSEEEPDEASTARPSLDDLDLFRLARAMSRTGASQAALDDIVLHRIMPGATKRPRDKFEATDGKDITKILENKGAVAVVLYDTSTPNPEANDIWPECRSSAKLPACYVLFDRSKQILPESKSKRRAPNPSRRVTRSQLNSDSADEYLLDAPAGRPEWKLPVELVELIACHLNRDDIKSLRLVSRELNHYVSQVIFKTVVVPFNTEIYGMLGQEPKPDLKGKKRVKVENPGYPWTNATRDEVYNGHGLDVFRGFGKHILRYGMSFEVNEDSLATPPAKSLTEQKTSFWGNYDWPFEEYRRFATVAGLEFAADETPRMKIAFSELNRVKELALSVDSGLGWLNGPDRSIRARILQRPQQVFGSPKDVPDRRSQAQQELWRHIEACHESNGSDVRLATLYRLDGQRPMSELKEASMVTEEQPDMPYLDPRLIHEATPHDTADLQIPTSFDDPDVLGRFVLTPSSSGSGTGVLFSSIKPPTDAGQLIGPIIPANLTEAQKEWLLETEWAQRAFMSSYMLSVIDNPVTFNPVHTLKISQLSARYLPLLNRADFWEALPNLTDVTLMVLPEWRTVKKDEAGFVDTPNINPSMALLPFCNLLRNQVACRPNIRNLTIGWVTGGEHAEGMHARNRLIMPAPLMDVGASEMLVENDINGLWANLLHFRHVDRLTLENCWITPPAMVQFVKIHDVHSMKHLVLDSVSLTAMLRPNEIANQAVQQVAALNPPAAGLLGAGMLWNALHNNGGAQMLPNQQQFFQVYMQTLQVQLQQLQANAGGVQQQTQIVALTALQNQLQQQIAQLQAQNHNNQLQVQPQGQGVNQAIQHQQAQPQPNFNHAFVTFMQQTQHHIPAVQPPHVPGNAQPQADPQADPQSVLKMQPREGSWMNIIDIISPGTNLSDFDSEHSQADAERSTSLQSIEFISCGYARLPYAPFSQTAIEADNGLAAILRSPVLTKRYQALAPAMLSAKWPHLGVIVQEVDSAELAALDAGWNLRTGWKDAEEARAVEFDGLLSGGTGRFTGKVQASDRVAEGSSAS
ncbi:uncharacterized protein K460DRAFT_317699 [Cucurbitaria berberidis CBS 394.84]|uniref:F-box domain-containing protein n=1 Tax=Cucurbitaria berberidis CBS 394.84 TaxID=1168544 RepID=A0A9P4GF48_9PLEO|nr:uncharacterized protein K460DRAFT_317699 [Cucurbitaria berberidis CBS 394.84]KAF1844304.1 hypothetical protein K460DRAFT_317699 [Cucurbitaria berberidis CBS 394.84]